MRRRGSGAGVGPMLAMVVSSVLASACVAKPTSVPIPTLQYPDRVDEPRRLIVMLPGMGDEAADYARYEFIDELRSAGVEGDVIAVDAHYGYYARRSLIERLDEDVLDPARVAGYDDIWLVGISMGGLGALLTASHDTRIDGVILLSPYLGRTPVLNDVAEAGGLAKWEPSGRDDYTTEIWSWLKLYTDPERAPTMPMLFLGYGDDEHLQGFDLLADALPPSHVFAVRGQHKWTTWQRIWGDLLAKRPFDRSEGGRT